MRLIRNELRNESPAQWGNPVPVISTMLAGALGFMHLSGISNILSLLLQTRYIGNRFHSLSHVSLIIQGG